MRTAEISGGINAQSNGETPDDGYLEETLMGVKKGCDGNAAASEENQHESAYKLTQEFFFHGRNPSFLFSFTSLHF